MSIISISAVADRNINFDQDWVRQSFMLHFASVSILRTFPWALASTPNAAQGSSRALNTHIRPMAESICALAEDLSGNKTSVTGYRITYLPPVIFE
jgi:hypothetical protein